jgi:hypothetical protein
VHGQLVDDVFVAVDDRGGVYPLCGSIPMTNTNVLLAAVERRDGHS